MTQQGAALQTYNVELVKCIEDLKRKRAELLNSIENEEHNKGELQNEIEKLSYRLSQMNNSLSKKVAALGDYDRIIAETEAAYAKILESSQILLNMARREAVNLEQGTNKKLHQEHCG